MEEEDKQQEEGITAGYTELLGCLNLFCEAIPQISVLQLIAADLKRARSCPAGCSSDQAGW